MERNERLVDFIPDGDQRIMREGDNHLHQHHPIFMSISINHLLDRCNGFLLDQAGAIGASVHHFCTINMNIYAE